MTFQVIYGRQRFQRNQRIAKGISKQPSIAVLVPRSPGIKEIQITCLKV